MGHRIAVGCVLLTLLFAASAGTATAQDDLDYLDAVELLYDPDTGTLIDPETGAEVTHERFAATDIVAFQDRVDTRNWEVPDFLGEEALAFLFDEIALLAALDMITPNPEIERVGAHYAGSLGDMDRQTLLAGLDEVDQILDQIKGDILRTGAVLPDALNDALGDMSPDWQGRLAAGERLPAGPYVAAMSALISRGAAGTLPPELLGVEFIGLERKLDILTFPEDLAEFVATSPAPGFGIEAPLPVRAAAGTTLGQPSDAVTPSTTIERDWLLVGSAAVAAVIVASAVVAIRRRTRGSHLDDETLRLLIDAETERRVAVIACGQAVGATAASTALLARPVAGGLHQVRLGATVAGSVLQRVVDTGTPLDQTVTDDPLLGAGPQITLAVPLVNNGTVVGVLAVSRTSGSFNADARSRLERLAPNVGAALANVDRLGSAARLALVDELTNLGNRRRLDHDLDATVRSAVADGTPVAFAMLDVDHFKHFNDTNGHAAGDRALQAVADVIARHVRHEDVVYRYGGEEFSILLPNASAEEAAQVAERVRAAVESAPIPGEQSQPGGRLTVSVGVANLPAPGPTAIAQRADEALYEAKQNGRNRVVMESEILS